jgi:hypothetical protein
VEEVYGSGGVDAYFLEFLNVGCGFKYDFSARGRVRLVCEYSVMSCFRRGV